MDRNFSDVSAYGFRDTLAERQTQKQRDRQAQGHVHHYTVLSYRRRNDKIFMLKLNSTTRTRPDPHGPNGVSPQKQSVRVRSGPCRVRVVEFSYYLTRLEARTGVCACEQCPIAVNGGGADIIGDGRRTEILNNNNNGVRLNRLSCP